MNQKELIEPLLANDEIDLMSLVRNIWRQRGLVIAVTLFTVLAIMSFHLSKASFAVPRQVDYALSLTFLSDGKSSYPSGVPFSPESIMTPAILQYSLQATGLELSAEKLAAAMQVEFSNSLLKAGEDKLAALLVNTKTPEDIRMAAGEALSEMQNQGRSYLTISLDLDKAEVSVSTGAQLVRKVAQTWANMAIDRGLMDVAIDRPLTPFVVAADANLIDSYDNASAYLSSLSAAGVQLAKVAGSGNLVVNGASLGDVQREIDALQTTEIGPLREFAYSNSTALAETDPAIQVRLFARKRLLKLEHERLTKLIVSYDAALEQLRYTNGSEVRGGAAQEAGSGAPQFDQSFLDALLQLGAKLGSVENRKQLFERRTRAVEALLSLEKEMAILSGVVTKDYAQLNPQTILKEALVGIIGSVNRLQQNMNAFVVTHRELMLQNSGQLYLADAAPQVRGGKSQVALKLSLHLMLGMVLGGMLGVMVALVRAAMVGRQKSS